MLSEGDPEAGLYDRTATAKKKRAGLPGEPGRIRHESPALHRKCKAGYAEKGRAGLPFGGHLRVKDPLYADGALDVTGNTPAASQIPFVGIQMTL